MKIYFLYGVLSFYKSYIPDFQPLCVCMYRTKYFFHYTYFLCVIVHRLIISHHLLSIYDACLLYLSLRFAITSRVRSLAELL